MCHTARHITGPVMTSATPLLRFHGAVPHDPAVDAWLAAKPGALGDLARTWFDAMRQCGDEVRELVHEGTGRFMRQVKLRAG